MSKLRDDKDRFLKQNPPKTNQPSVGAGTSTTEKYESTTPTAGKNHFGRIRGKTMFRTKVNSHRKTSSIGS
jgi:hypothetical protein